MNGTKSAKEYRKGEQLEITEEKMTEETLEKIEEIFQEFLEITLADCIFPSALTEAISFPPFKSLA